MPQIVTQQGRFYLEMVAATIVISVLMAIALSRLWGLTVDAERIAMENTLGSLRSALGIKVAEYISKGDIASVETLVGSNPMDRLAELPKNYIGALGGVDPAGIEDGKWYFDTDSKMLIYRVHNQANFVSSLGPPARARFAVQLVYAEKNKSRVIEGVRLTAIEPYRWVD